MIPHLNHLYSRHMVKQGAPDLTHQEYLEWDTEILHRCDGLLKLADSPGADHEEAVARKNQLPVFTSMDQVKHWRDCKYCRDRGGATWNRRPPSVTDALLSIGPIPEEVAA